MFESFRPLHAVVQALELPQVLHEMQHASVCVGAGVGIAGALVVDERVGRDVFVDQERWDAYPETGEVVFNLVLVADALELHAILRSRDAGWRRDVVGKATVLVEVDDEESGVPVFALTDRVVEVLDHHLAGGHVGGGVHAVDGAATNLESVCISLPIEWRACSP